MHNRQVPVLERSSFGLDDSLILSHEDKDESPYTSGWLGFRQMKWSHFAYSDLKIWDWGNMTKTVRSERGGRYFSKVCYQHIALVAEQDKDPTRTQDTHTNHHQLRSG